MLPSREIVLVKIYSYCGYLWCCCSGGSGIFFVVKWFFGTNLGLVGSEEARKWGLDEKGLGRV